MSERRESSDGLPETTSDTGALANAVEESRREYDKKVATTKELDDRTMRNVRIAVLAVGVVVSSLGVAGPDVFRNFSILPTFVGSVGVVALLSSIVLGIGTTNVTNYPSGIGQKHRVDVVTGGYDEDEWYVNVMVEYDMWSSIIDQEMELKRRLLEAVKFSLLLGVSMTTVSVAMVVTSGAYDISWWIVLAGILAIGFVVVVSVHSRRYIVDRD